MQPTTHNPNSSGPTLTITLPKAQAFTAIDSARRGLFTDCHPPQEWIGISKALDNATEVKVGNGYQLTFQISEPSAKLLVTMMREKQKKLANSRKKPDQWTSSKIRKTADKIQAELDELAPDLNAPGATAKGDDCPF